MQKRKTIYIHIGTPKTGTSSIQSFLAQNKTLLVQKKIFYPTIGRYSTRDGTFANGSLFFDAEQYEKTLNMFSKSEFSTMLVSEENLFLHLHQENQLAHNDRLWELLSNYDVKIIIYFRQSAEYVTSLWQQSVKNMYKKNLEEYLETTDYAVSLETSDYAECLEGIYDLSTRVGLNNMIVRTYEPTRWLHHDLIDDFLSILNIEKSDEFLLSNEKKNISYTRDHCERILYVNQYLETKEGGIYRINLIVPKGDNPQTVLESLSDEMIKKITDKYYPLECEIAKKFLNRDELFLTKYPKIYQTKRPAYQLNITKQELKELWSIISYDVQRQILAKQKLQEELLQKISTQQELRHEELLAKQEELLQKILTQQELQHQELLQKIPRQQELRHEEKIKSRFSYILLKPLLIIYNIICYKSTRKYIIKRLLRG